MTAELCLIKLGRQLVCFIQPLLELTKVCAPAAAVLRQVDPGFAGQMLQGTLKV